MPSRARSLGFDSIQTKLLIATSGALLTAWAVLHAAGTLGVFAGPVAMNRYANFLRELPGFLWGMRLGLVVLFLLHVILSLRLMRAAGRARPQGYRMHGPRRRSRLSRTMRFTGPLLGIWLIYHVLHMYGPFNPDPIPGDVHHNLLVGLRQPLANFSYVVASLLFGLHLGHGLSSVLQTLGIVAPWRRLLSAVAWTTTFALLVGFLAPSLAVYLGWL